MTKYNIYTYVSSSLLRPVRVLLGFASPNATLTLEDDFVFFSLIHAVQIFFFFFALLHAGIL